MTSCPGLTLYLGVADRKNHLPSVLVLILKIVQLPTLVLKFSFFFFFFFFFFGLLFCENIDLYLKKKDLLLPEGSLCFIFSTYFQIHQFDLSFTIQSQIRSPNL